MKEIFRLFFYCGVFNLVVIEILALMATNFSGLVILLDWTSHIAYNQSK